MLNFNVSDEYTPLFYAGRFPVYVTTLLVAAHTTAMILFALIAGFGGDTFLGWLTLTTPELFNGALWQPITYLFVQPPSLWFLIQMAMLYVFGREVERFLGRAAFIRLYVALAITLPVLVVMYGLATPVVYPEGGSGSSLVHFALFLAFALIYPTLEIIWVIQARWVAVALLGLYSLVYFAAQDWVQLGLLWPMTFVAYIMCCQSGVTDRFGIYTKLCEWMPAKTKEPVPVGSGTRREPVRAAARRSQQVNVAKASGVDGIEDGDLHELIDPLLDKIAAKGIASLTHKEREVLEKARDRLLKAEGQSKSR